MGQMSNKPKNLKKIQSPKVEICRNRLPTYGCEVRNGDFWEDICPASKVLLFFETCFLRATSSTDSSGKTRMTSCYCLCLFLCCSSATVVLLCALVLAALQATFVLL